MLSGRRVFVTGHTGFKGGWLCMWLKKLGAEVCGYSLEPPTDPNLFSVIGLESELAQHHIGDIRDRETITKCMKDFDPEVVFHLAAQPIVGLGYREPVETFDTNIMGTVNTLEAVRQCSGIRACVVVTSDKCYENREWASGYRETDPMGGHDPYSASKGAAEIVTASYRRSYFHPQGPRPVPVATARAGNVIGGGDWAEGRIIPDFVRAVGAGKPLELRSPGAIRPWQFVLEPLSGYLLLANRLMESGMGFAGAWNFGPKDALPMRVEQVIALAAEAWGGGQWHKTGDDHPHEAGLLRLDTGKANLHLGWQPVYDTTEAIQQTIAWYRAHHDSPDSGVIRAFTETMLDDYASRIRYTNARIPKP